MALHFSYDGKNYAFSRTEILHRIHCRLLSSEFYAGLDKLVKSSFGADIWKTYCIKEFPSRIIMLSDTMETPTLDKLWSYLRHFYSKIDSAIKDQFSFEDLAGIYTENGISKIFAVCIRYAAIDGLKELPEGRYLCANCTEENRDEVLHQLLHTAQLSYGSMPAFSVQYIVMSGILQWNYQIQIPL